MYTDSASTIPLLESVNDLMSALATASGTPCNGLNAAPGPEPRPSSVPQPPSPASASERDGRGRFAPGNKGGPGNPFARRSATLRQAMLDAVTAEDLQALVRQLIQKARDGEVAA